MYKYFKRSIEFITSLILLILLIPIFVVTALLIWIFMGQPIVFSHMRIGLNERPFKTYKFRTLLNNIEGQKLSDNERLTKLGAFLRKFSIDEFPQLYNILRGDMSFIGPRPLLGRYLPYYNDREKLRHKVRPGMGGLAQVSGRSYLTWDEQFEFDAIYVERFSFSLDLTIVLKTIYIVLFSKNMMVTGRVDNECFDLHRIAQLKKAVSNPFNTLISTDRLLLRKLNLGDAQDMFEYTQNTEVTKYLSWNVHSSIEQTQLFIKNTMLEYGGLKTFPYAIELVESNKFIGVLRVFDVDIGNKHCEISYILNPNYQNKGYMVEAIQAIIQHCFDNLGFVRIQAKCMVDNVNSERLMQRSGMQFEGLLKNYWIYKGKVLDAKMYSICKYSI